MSSHRPIERFPVSLDQRATDTVLATGFPPWILRLADAIRLRIGLFLFGDVRLEADLMCQPSRREPECPKGGSRNGSQRETRLGRRDRGTEDVYILYIYS